MECCGFGSGRIRNFWRILLDPDESGTEIYDKKTIHFRQLKLNSRQTRRYKISLVKIRTDVKVLLLPYYRRMYLHFLNLV
jgi:hypothetical protein